LKKFISLVIALMVLFIFSACANNSEGEPVLENESGKDAPKEKVTVFLDWVPNTNHTGLYVAKDQGYFAEQGLDVEIIQPSDSGAAQLVAAGQGDFGVSYQEEVTNARAMDIPIKSIAAVIQHNTSAFASPVEKNIKTPKDFEGKKYGGWGSPMEHAMLASLMKKNGADVSKVEEVNIGTADFFTSVERNVDFSWIFYGWDGIQAELKDYPLNVIMVKDADPALDYYTPVLIASEKMLAERPDVTKRFLKAVSDGYKFAIENPEESAEILLNYAPELDPELVKASQIWLADKYQDDAPAWGVQKPEVWEKYADWMFEYGLLEKEIVSEDAFTNEFLPEN
jgi:ABC-type nitrate/sulfonate/bicarbonate transport system substrate-binding protein